MPTTHSQQTSQSSVSVAMCHGCDREHCVSPTGEFLPHHTGRAGRGPRCPGTGTHYDRTAQSYELTATGPFFHEGRWTADAD